MRRRLPPRPHHRPRHPRRRRPYHANRCQRATQPRPQPTPTRLQHQHCERRHPWTWLLTHISSSPSYYAVRAFESFARPLSRAAGRASLQGRCPLVLQQMALWTAKAHRRGVQGGRPSPAAQRTRPAAVDALGRCLKSELVEDGFDAASSRALVEWLHGQWPKMATKLSKRMANSRKRERERPSSSCARMPASRV